MNARRHLLTTIALVLLVCAALAPVARADTDVTTAGEGAGQTLHPRGVAVDFETGRLYVADSGNHRIDAFDDEGHFELAWGWGVADGSPEAQTCGPAATPPTATCLAGLPGGGAGQFTRVEDIAVDNDPASPSQHAVYVVDSAGVSGALWECTDSRVQKFGQEGDFQLAFGGGVVSGGAEGAGDLTTGSKLITDVVTSKKAFAVSQTITGTGIPAGTVITGIGDGTLTLSRPAEASGTDVPLTVAEGPGNVPVNEVEKIDRGLYENLGFATPLPDRTEAGTGASAEGLLHGGSTTITGVTISSGTILPGEFVDCCGGSNSGEAGSRYPLFTGAKVTAFNAGTGKLTISPAAFSTVPNVPVAIRVGIGGRDSQFNRIYVTAAFLEDALLAMPNLEPGDIAVRGISPGTYEIEFKGPRYADTNVDQLQSVDLDRELVGPVNGGSAPVQGASGAEICRAAEAASCAAGVEGAQDGAFAQLAHVAVGPDGKVYVVDSILVSRTSAGTTYESRVQEFDPDGSFVRSISLGEEERPAAGIAVEGDGSFYVSVHIGDGAVRKYDSSGALLGELSVATSVSGISLASDGSLFAAEVDAAGGAGSNVIGEYDGTSTATRRFGYGDLQSQNNAWGSVASHEGPGGDVYATVEDVVRDVDFPPPGPLVRPVPCEANPIGNTHATLNALVNPEGKLTTVRFEYVDQESFEGEGGFASPETRVAPDVEIGPDARLVQAQRQVEVLPETTYHCRALVTNADNEAGVTVPEGTFTTLPPFEFGAVWSAAVGEDTATLNATVNPLGSPAGGYFEYVDDATFQQSGFAAADRAPAAPDELSFGAGEEPKLDSVVLADLQPATTYHYRLAVDAHVIPVRYDSPSTFRTRAALAGGTPDERTYELVSPLEKNSAEVSVPNNAGGGSAIRQAAPDGEAVTYGSFTAFADPESAPTPSQYLSRRTPLGWVTQNVNLFGRMDRQIVPYQGFSQSLGFGAALSLTPPLGAECPSDVENLYWRDNSTGAVRCLTEGDAPKSSSQFCPVFAGSAADGSTAIFIANGSIGGAPRGNGFSIYRWSPSGGVSLVSTLPNGNDATPMANTGVGAAHFGDSLCSAQGFLHNAVSTDGSRVFWHYAGEYAGSPEPLFASTLGGPTVQLDASQGGSGVGGEGDFLAAASDGSTVFFSSPGGQVADASGGVDLYRYDFSAEPGSRLTDLTPGSLTPGSEPAGVQGMLGAAENGDTAYFAATGKLTAEPNAGGEHAQPGKSNVYLWRAGKGIAFVATVSAASDWSDDPTAHTAAASPDGRHLVFLAVDPLTGYDNRSQADGAPQQEVYLYDAGAATLSCVSCDPTGQRPASASKVPGWTSPFEGPRYLSGDGSRVFFETANALVQGDLNGVGDVYEFERPGSGTCAVTSATYDPGANGCLYLISGGEGAEPAYLDDASVDGRDVFFSTRQQMVAEDKDERYDLYDYRVHGFPPQSPPAPPCLGEACKPPPSPVPAPPGSPVTEGFHGTGNVSPAKAHKRSCRKAKRKGRRAKAHCRTTKHRRHRHHKHKHKHRRHGKSSRRGGNR